jgi:hypothetical protein
MEAMAGPPAVEAEAEVVRVIDGIDRKNKRAWANYKRAVRLVKKRVPVFYSTMRLALGIGIEKSRALYQLAVWSECLRRPSYKLDGHYRMYTLRDGLTFEAAVAAVLLLPEDAGCFFYSTFRIGHHESTTFERIKVNVNSV